VDDAFIRYSRGQQSVVTKLTKSHNRVEDVSNETGRKILEVLEIILGNTPHG
jgi:hypothetical protein